MSNNNDETFWNNTTTNETPIVARWRQQHDDSSEVIPSTRSSRHHHHHHHWSYYTRIVGMVTDAFLMTFLLVLTWIPHLLQLPWELYYLLVTLWCLRIVLHTFEWLLPNLSFGRTRIVYYASALSTLLVLLTGGMVILLVFLKDLRVHWNHRRVSDRIVDGVVYGLVGWEVLRLLVVAYRWHTLVASRLRLRTRLDEVHPDRPWWWSSTPQNTLMDPLLWSRDDNNTRRRPQPPPRRLFTLFGMNRQPVEDEEIEPEDPSEDWATRSQQDQLWWSREGIEAPPKQDQPQWVTTSSTTNAIDDESKASWSQQS